MQVEHDDEAVLEDSLSTRTRNGVLKKGIDTIEKLHDAWDQGVLPDFEGMGPKALDEIRTLLDAYPRRGAPKNAVGGTGASRSLTDTFGRALESEDRGERGAFRSKLVGELDLPFDVTERFQSHDVLTVGDLLWVIRVSAGPAAEFVRSNRTLIDVALRRLRLGPEAWEKEEDDRRGVPDLSSLLGQDASAVIPAVAHLIGENPLQLFQEVDLRAARLYFGLAGSEPLTLEEVGQELGVTRQRVEQLVQRLLGTLGQVLRGERKFRKREIRVSGSFLNQVATLERLIEVQGFLFETEIEEELDLDLSVSTGHAPPQVPAESCRGPDDSRSEVRGTPAARYFRMVEKALDLQRLRLPSLSSRLPEPCLVHPKDRIESRAVHGAVRSILASFRDETLWCAPGTFLVRVAPLFRLFDEGPNEMDWIATHARARHLLPLELDPERGVRVPLPFLKTPGLQGRRVLEDHGAPLTLEEIHDRIGAAMVEAGADPPTRSTEPLRTALTNTPGVKPISKSGWWSLNSWEQVHTGPLRDLMLKILEEEGGIEPTALINRIRVQRPWVPDSTVLTYLYTHSDHFALDRDGKVIRGPSDPATRRVGINFEAGDAVRKRFRRAVRRILREEGPGPHPRALLIHKLAWLSGLDEGTLFRKMSRAAWATVDGWGERAVVLLDEERIPPVLIPGENRSEILETVVPCIRDALGQIPSGECLLRELRDQMERDHGILRSHFYYAVRQSPLLERRIENGKYRVRLAARPEATPEVSSVG